LNAHPAAIIYEPGSWGPAAADDFIAADGGWQNPAACRTRQLAEPGGCRTRRLEL